MKNFLTNELIQNGWTETQKDWEYQKGNWKVLRDTSSWLIVFTESNPRVFDIHEPEEYETRWTVNLIEHLCKMEDERYRLRKELESIKNSTDISSVQKISTDALDKCFHTWLVNGDKLHCPICKKEKCNANTVNK